MEAHFASHVYRLYNLFSPSRPASTRFWPTQRKNSTNITMSIEHHPFMDTPINTWYETCYIKFSHLIASPTTKTCRRPGDAAKRPWGVGLWHWRRAARGQTVYHQCQAPVMMDAALTRYKTLSRLPADDPTVLDMLGRISDTLSFLALLSRATTNRLNHVPYLYLKRKVRLPWHQYHGVAFRYTPREMSVLA